MLINLVDYNNRGNEGGEGIMVILVLVILRLVEWLQLMIFETCHYNSLGRKYFGELQLEYKHNDKFFPFSNYNQWLPPYLFYTDTTSCAMDGFNLGIGRQVLT